MAGRVRPLFTENFAANLESVRLFLEAEGRPAFGRLLSRLFDDIVPTLCRFPQSGHSMLTHPVGSLEAEALLDRLKGELRKGDDLREFVVDDVVCGQTPSRGLRLITVYIPSQPKWVDERTRRR